MGSQWEVIVLQTETERRRETGYGPPLNTNFVYRRRTKPFVYTIPLQLEMFQNERFLVNQKS